jgi:energy-coupling factor transporter ATP-binding protein EcfA2
VNRSPYEPAPSPASRDRGPLRPIELATAAVLGAMTVVFVLVGSFVPHASGVAALGAVPMGVIAQRHRPRAVVAGVVASISVSFIIAGTGVVSTITLCGCIGGLAGHARRQQWGAWGLLGAAAVLGPLLAGASDGLLWAFASLRKLTFRQLLSTTHGLAALVGRALDLLVGWVPGWSHVGARVTRRLDLALAFGFRNWWGLIALVVICFTVAATVTVWLLLRPILEQLDQVKVTDRLAPAVASPSAATLVVAPVPVRLVDVTVRYPGADADALSGVSMGIEAQQLTVVLGPNGSGKSTLARVLAGCPPTSGQVLRPGACALGQAGGTAVIAQRPESQVLGVRVIDDMVWGLPNQDVDVSALLRSVGLAGMERRYTSGLSGGELQRLAVASALARRPQLLISDESTAMVDAEGRRTLIALLGRLPAERAMSVVHVTHRIVETAGADQLLRLSCGREVDGAGAVAGDDTAAAPGHAPTAVTGAESDGATPDEAGVETHPRPERGATAPTSPTLRLVGVGHVYAGGTPWATTALRDVTLEIGGGSGVLVLGGNGSGKSTLAWVLAGLLRPTSGRCELDGRPVDDQVGAVGLAFQHARLQVQGPTVGRDVRTAGNVERAAAEAALGLVGLNADELWGRSVDELSGGQLRRVALAGLLARAPRALVLDEPLAGLDDASRAGLAGVLSRLRTHEGVTLVVITHELAGLDEVCDRVVRLERGRVVADGPFGSVDVDDGLETGDSAAGLAPIASRAQR